MDVVISPVAIALASANCLWIMWRGWRKRQNDRQLAAINSQIQQITSAVVSSKDSLDVQIEKAVEELLSHPSQAQYLKVIELVIKSQEELFNAIQFSSVEEFDNKRKVIRDLVAESLSKLDDVLLEKGIATAVGENAPNSAGAAGTGLNDASPPRPAPAPVPKGSTIKIVEPVAPKSNWCCCGG